MARKSGTPAESGSQEAEDDSNGEGDQENIEEHGLPADASEPIAPIPPAIKPLADNERDVDIHKCQEEHKMGKYGHLPTFKFSVKRVEPQKVIHPQYGFSIDCYNQRRSWEGPYETQEIEQLSQEYFGGGVYLLMVYTENWKIKDRRTLRFPGDPNITHVIADCVTSEQLAKFKAVSEIPVGEGAMQAARQSLGITVTGRPKSKADAAAGDDPVLGEIKRMNDEATLAEAAIAKEERLIASEEKKIELDRQRRVIKRVRAEDVEGSEYSFGNRPPHRRGFSGRPGSYEPEPLPVSDLDRPVSTRDLLHQREVDALREQSRDTAHKLEQVLEKNHQPRTNIVEMIAALTTAAAPILSKVLEISSQNSKAQAESQKDLMKAILDSGKSSDKQIELFIQALGLRDQRQANTTKEMVELIKLGSEMGSNESGSWVSDVGKALGDVAGGIAGAITAAKQPPQQMIMMPQHQLPPPSAIPMPGRTAPAPAPNAVRVQPQLPAPPAAVAPAASAAPAAAPSQPAGDKSMNEDDMRKLAKQVLTLAMQEAETKPAQAKWVEIAYDRLPEELLKAVANAKSEKDLIPIFQPYVDLMMLMSFGNKIKSDPAIEPWLRKGFEELQAMAREEINGPAEAVPETEPEKDVANESEAQP